MRKKLSMNPRQRQRFRLTAKPVLVAASMGFFLAVFIKLTALHQLAEMRDAKAAPALSTFTPGSFIVNMGITPQTYENGLLPYGMVYELMTDHKVPVYWVIDTTKSKDGADFSYDGTDYKGSAFIIDAGFMIKPVTDVIASWQTQGVTGVYTTSSISVPVYEMLTRFPNIIIDTLAGFGYLGETYFQNAGIPDSAYSFGAPDDLTECMDLWINPHADPDFNSHSNLYKFATEWKGNIWSQCHAPSVLEGLSGTMSINATTTAVRMSFLASDGLQCFKKAGACGDSISQDHKNAATTPFSYNYPGDPVMQFLGSFDNVTKDGSEQWYIPQTTGKWRTGTKLLIETSDGAGDYKGAAMVYGHALGNSNNGRIMYTGGHILSGGPDSLSTVPEHVAAQRSLLNYVLLTGIEKAPDISSFSIPTSYNQTRHLLYVRTTEDTLDYTFQWTATINGVFSNPNGATTYFTPLNYLSDTIGYVSVTITDACNRLNLVSVPFNYSPSLLPVTMAAFRAKVNVNDQVDLEWMTMSEVNNDYFTIERSADGWRWDEVARVEGAGTTTTATKYGHTDEQPLPGISWYRLRQTDYNGRSEVFSRAQVNLPLRNVRAGSLKAFPNPFDKSLTAQFTADQNEEVSLQLLTLEGKKIYDERIVTGEGVNSISLSLPANINPGIYMLHVTNESSMVASAKVLKRFH